jgi:three-Cys-motif partner protein
VSSTSDSGSPTGELFSDLPTRQPLRKYLRPSVPVWTEHKANFIQRYLKLFIQITKHGTYIDGFAGPQRPSMRNAWSARLVLQITPPRLRHFFLCEKKAKSFKLLKKCVDEMPRQKARSIELFEGDFNDKVDEILKSGYLTEREAVFALLDQRMFECHWRTVEKLAQKKKSTKIELFYFFGSGWVKRALAGVKKNHHVVESWWGRSDFRNLGDKTPDEITEILLARFQSELNYKHVIQYPIYKRQGNHIVMYKMLHATDHNDAPELMNRAYRQAVRNSGKPAEQLLLLPH